MVSSDARLRRVEKLTGVRTLGSQPAVNLVVPNIIEFVTDPKYLNRPNLYPRQATLLKIMCLEVDLLTDYDLSVIAEWESGFHLETHDGQQAYVGAIGLAPGTVERMLACKSQGRHWFREVTLVLGRRAGKGYLGALLGSYVLWNLLAKGDPQRHFNLEQTKQLTAMVFAAERTQATANQFRDLAQIISSAPCFSPYLGTQGAELLRLYTPADQDRLAGGSATNSGGSLVVDARASTGVAGRGPAAIALFFDEMAHMASPGLQRSSDEVYAGAAPALAQFPTDSLVFMASSPGSQVGEFYAAYLRALAMHDGKPVDPTVLAVQLPSWGTYQDWELTAQGLAMYPGGADFTVLVGPIIADNETLRALQRENPDTFAVEYQAAWRTSRDHYLDPELVHKIFDTYNGQTLPMQKAGRGDATYVMHADPSLSGANFAVAIGHCEKGPDGLTHVVFDYLGVFRPQDFDDGRIDYLHVEYQLLELIKAFIPSRSPSTSTTVP